VYLVMITDAGISINVGGRNLRPTINLPGWTVKLLKPRNVVEMIHHGTRDVGFAGIDLIKARVTHKRAECTPTARANGRQCS
jgi:ATP phosphoribosyltransferase